LAAASFLASAAAALVGLSSRVNERPKAGSSTILPDGPYLARSRRLPRAKRVEKFPVVIVEAESPASALPGAFGKRGFTDFVLLEMNAQPAATGAGAKTKSPRIPGPPTTCLSPAQRPNMSVTLRRSGSLEERPVGRTLSRFHRRSGCSLRPLAGSIEPAVAFTPKDRDQLQRLDNLFSEFRKSGSFTVPLKLGLSPKFQDLDRISFSDWLRNKASTPVFCTGT